MACFETGWVDGLETSWWTPTRYRPDNKSLFSKLAGRALTRYWFAYKFLFVKLCVNRSRTAGNINYKEYRVYYCFQVHYDKRPAPNVIAYMYIHRMKRVAGFETGRTAWKLVGQLQNRPEVVNPALTQTCVCTPDWQGHVQVHACVWSMECMFNTCRVAI